MKKLFLFVLLIQLMACDSSLKFIQIADKQATEGNYSDAADNYYTAFFINPKNTKAKLGLQKNTQIVLDAKFSAFGKHVVSGDNEDALRQYNYCKDYFNHLKNIGIDLNWQTLYDQLYEETKQEFISKQYDIGLGLIKENKFDKAELAFDRILEFDSSYKNVSVLRIQSVVEPLYNQGLKYMEVKNYKTAYKVFGQVASFDNTYKQTLQLLNESLQKASLPLAAILVSKKTFANQEDSSFYQLLLNKLSNTNNPFLKIIDRNSLENQLKEKAFEINEIIDTETASKAGKLIGAKYFLLIDVNDIIFDELKPTTSIENAYESFSQRVVNETGDAQSVIKFKKVSYKETKQYRKVAAKVSYQLVSVQSGQIISSEAFSDEAFDVHVYARFDGNKDNLYPNLPAGNFMPNAPKEWTDKFYELNRNIASQQSLANKTYEAISLKIIDDINLYMEQ
jgi:tetratricopeptide (TPR) repeat protein